MNPALNWRLLVAVLALATAGCASDGYYHDRNIDYAQAREAAPLALPESHAPERYRDTMPVPDVRGEFRATAEDGFEVPSPQPLAAGSADDRDFVSRREIGTDQWLVVATEPGTVWPELERFVRNRGFEIVERDSSRGLLVTDQARLRLRPGVRPGDSEVHCDRDGKIVEACLTAVERHLEENRGAASASSLATRDEAPRPRARLERVNGEWQLHLPFGIDRTWAELHHQLERDFSVAGRRELIEADPGDHRFVIDYLTASERRQGMLHTLMTLDFGDSIRRLALQLEAAGTDESVLQVRPVDDDVSAADRRELLERMASLLR